MACLISIHHTRGSRGEATGGGAGMVIPERGVAVKRRMKSLCSLMALMTACGIARAAPDARGFEFTQGVVVDASHPVVYMPNANARILAVSLTNGEVIAISTRGTKPLLLYDDALLAAAQDRSDALTVIGLTAKDLKPKFELELPIPSGVQTGSFHVGARIWGKQIIVQWRSIRRPISAIPTTEPAVVRTGFARIDPANGRLIAAAEGEPPAPPPPEIPAAARKLADEGRLASPFCPVDNLVAALQFVDEDGKNRMVLRRWSRDTGKGMPAITLFDNEFTFRNFSRDCRHLLASKGLDGFVWQIYSTVTGQRITELHNPLPGPEFFVSDSNLIYQSPAAGGETIAGRLKIEPPRLVVISLNNGEELWARPIGETAYIGPYPGNPPVPSTEQ
jgi:hypothetical protein